MEGRVVLDSRYLANIQATNYSAGIVISEKI
jgi:hypothetical protein